MSVKHLLFLCFSISCQSVLANDLMKWISDPLQTREDTSATKARYNANPCSDSESKANDLTFDMALHLALCNNPKIKFSLQSIELSFAELGEARSAYLPNASASIGRQNNTTSYSSISDKFVQTGNQLYLSVNWRLLDFGGRAAALSSSNFLVESAMYGHAASIQQVTAEIIRAFYDVAAAKAIYKLRSEMVEVAEKTLSISQRRLNSGAATQQDVLQASKALSKSNLLASNAKGEWLNKLAALKFSMGISQSIDISSIDFDFNPDLSPIGELNEWLALARANHPAIKQARAAWQSEKEKLVMTISSGRPSLDLVSYYSTNGYPRQALSLSPQSTVVVGLTLNIPLFSGFADSYKIKGAQLRAAQGEIQVDYVTSKVLSDVAASYSEVSRAFDAVYATKSLRKASRDSYDSALRRYQLGVTDVIEVLNSQVDLFDSGQEFLKANSDFLSSKLQLISNSGSEGIP